VWVRTVKAERKIPVPDRKRTKLLHLKAAHFDALYDVECVWNKVKQDASVAESPLPFQRKDPCSHF
jgi:hypothetical protein